MLGKVKISCLLDQALLRLEIVQVTSEPIPDGRHERHLHFFMHQDSEAGPDREGEERRGEGA